MAAFPPPGVQPPDRPRLLLSGIDSLYVSYYIDPQSGLLDFVDLNYCKERLKQSRGEAFSEIELGSEAFALKPHGKHPYSFILVNEAFQVCLGEFIRPACHVQYLSQCLWQEGVGHCTDRFLAWCRSMELEHTAPEVVSRVDFAFDYAVPAIDFTADDFVTRATKDSSHRSRRHIQTITFGRGDIVIRVYDKVAEIEEQSGKAWFYALWGQQQGVWRIEFQVRRGRLQEAEIDSLADLRDLQTDLVHELAEKHTTLRRPSADTNRARWPLHPLWRALLDDIESMSRPRGIPGATRVNTLPILEHRRTRQARSIYGFLKALAAVETELRGEERAISVDDVLLLLPALIGQHHNDIQWRHEVEQRLSALRLGQW